MIVRLLPGEQEAIEALASQIGVTTPVVSGRLRRNAGRCVFLTDERRCRLHARFGASAKPAVCQQFPVLAAEGERVVDPGCHAAWATREVGDPLPPPRVVEDRPLAIQHPDTVRDWLAALVEVDPDVYLAAVLERLDTGRWTALVDHIDSGPVLREALAPLRGRIDPADWPPPDWDAWVVRSVNTLVRFRIVPRDAAALCLAGGVVAWWAGGTEPGRLFAGWCRAVRSEVFREMMRP